MSATLLARIERDVKQLSREDRERLLADLTSKFEDAPLSEIDQAWIDEAERRYDDWKVGRTKAVPAGRAIAAMRRKLTR
jgi:putative addiction module component (TIGR02574 family)